MRFGGRSSGLPRRGRLAGLTLTGWRLAGRRLVRRRFVRRRFVRRLRRLLALLGRLLGRRGRPLLGRWATGLSGSRRLDLKAVGRVRLGAGEEVRCGGGGAMSWRGSCCGGDGEGRGRLLFRFLLGYRKRIKKILL
jgi:hypothetical protein